MFTNVKDPKERKRRVKSYEALKASLKKKFLADKLGKVEAETQLSRLFKPITEPMSEQTEKLKDIRERLNTPPLVPVPRRAIAFVQEQPGPSGQQPGPSGQQRLTIGSIARRYLETFGTKKGHDKTFGIRYEKNNGHFIGDKKVNFEGNNIIIGNKKYVGTEDLWHLLTQKEIKDNYDPEARKTYEEILIFTNALYHNHEQGGKVKSSRGEKYMTLIKSLHDRNKRGSTSGEGVRFYSDPNDLCARLQLLTSSRAAGNNSHDQEILDILKELRNKELLEDDEYHNAIRKFG